MEYEKGYVFDLMETGGPTDEERIKDIYRKYWDGMIRKDTDFLEIDKIQSINILGRQSL